MVVRTDVVVGRNVLLARHVTGDTTLQTVVDVPSVQSKLSLSLSPDGRWLAYTSSEAEGTIGV